MKSNEEINKDLGISESSSCDEEEDADATCDSKPTYSGRQGMPMISVFLSLFDSDALQNCIERSTVQLYNSAVECYNRVVLHGFCSE